LGESSDIWRVKPTKGAFYISDQIRYQGLIANIGMRLDYWFPGAYVDDAVRNPDALIPDEIRKAYYNSTYNFFGSRFKMRLLPRMSVSFPVRENQVLFFNYGHQARTPHPTFLYAGLDPFYQNRSFLANLGNPNLNQEVDVSYEIGVRNQLTSNDALNVSAFWRDKYDFITSERIIVRDATGRDVERAYRVNGDFARVRGLEAAYIKRHKDWFQGQMSVTYSRAEGLSSTTNDALQNIIAGGQSIGNNIETPLAWDRPWDIKSNVTFTYDRRNDPLFNVNALNRMKLYLAATYRSGQRYTPYLYKGQERNPVTGVTDWRPIYEVNTDPNKRYSKIGEPWFWMDLNFQKWHYVGRTKFTAFLEITNLLNNKNAAIINPVTGKAYKTDYPTDPAKLVALRDNRSYDLPSNVRDPRYVDPRNNSAPSYLNPANFLEQRHIMFGIAVNF
jgi:outer membrane receptor protein involved in Fe transport